MRAVGGVTLLFAGWTLGFYNVGMALTFQIHGRHWYFRHLTVPPFLPYALLFAWFAIAIAGLPPFLKWWMRPRPAAARRPPRPRFARWTSGRQIL